MIKLDSQYIQELVGSLKNYIMSLWIYLLEKEIFMEIEYPFIRNNWRKYISYLQLHIYYH